MQFALTVESIFGTRYLLSDWSCGQEIKLWYRLHEAYALARTLKVSASEWRQILHARCDNAHDLQHDLNRYSELDLVAEMLAKARLHIHPIPDEATLEACANLQVDSRSKGVVYRLLPQNAHLLGSGVKQHQILPPEKAVALVDEFDLSASQIEQLIPLLPPSRQNSAGVPRLRQALADGDLIVVGQPRQTRSSKSQIEESAPAPSEARPPSLGPHAEPGGQSVATVAHEQPQYKPPQSLEECEQRLQAARMRLRTDGYKPKYTDEQILAQAEKGELDDRFVVRLIETEHAGDDGYLGRPDATGRVRYWSTTFNQAENADTDPNTLAPLLGFTPKPGASYTLVVVDTQAPNAGQSLTLVPNHKNMGELSKGEIEGISAERVNEVMTPEYNEVYAEHMAAFETRKLNIQSKKDISGYANATFSDSDGKSRFKTRAAIHKKLGANQYHTGDGATKNLLPTGGRCGVMETLTIDKNPQTLGTLERTGTAKRLPAKRL